VRIISAGPNLSVVGLRTRYNERRSFLVTTTPPTAEIPAVLATETIFPQIADSGGYVTTFILYSTTIGTVSSGNLSFFSQTGVPLFLPIQ
jgi:hypothetical protein